MGVRPLPGAVHDLTAARIWGIIQALAASGLVVLGDKGYLGEDHIHVPYRGGNKPARATARQCPAQVVAHPAQTPLLSLAGRPAGQAIHVLQTREIGG